MPYVVAPIVCLVDDDSSVRKSLTRLLESAGYKVNAFDEPKTFLQHLAHHPVRLAVDVENHEAVDRAPGPAEQWEARWDRELMHLLLAELEKQVSPVNHRLLILRWIEGRPLAEVARLLTLSEKQVTYRQQRLFRKLRAARALYRGEPFGATSDGSTSDR